MGMEWQSDTRYPSHCHHICRWQKDDEWLICLRDGQTAELAMKIDMVSEKADAWPCAIGSL